MSSRAAARPKDPRRWIIALAVTFGTLMGAIDASIVNVALAQIRAAVGATVQEITWISTGFAIATVLVMPLTGFFSRQFGQKNVYLFCLALFLVGSLLCGIAWSLPSLVLFRVVQGLGAGALQPTEQAILRQTFPPEEQGTAMALFSVAVMVGPALGPTLGGYIVDNYHWSWIFFINLPVGVVGLWMVNHFVQEDPELVAIRKREAEAQRANVDWLGIALLWTGLVALQYVIEEGQAEDWFASNEILFLSIVAAFAAVGFVVRELTAPMPAVNLWLFADRTFAAGTLVAASVMSVMMSGMFLMPLFMQELLGFNATQSGLALMPRVLVMVVAMPVVGRLYPRFPPAVFAAGGFVLAALGQYQFALLTLESGSSDILMGIVLQGVGMSMVLVPITTVSLSTIPRERLSDATGLSSLVRQIGGSLGLALLSTLLTRQMHVATETVKWQLATTRPELLGEHGLAARVAGQGAVLGFEYVFLVGALGFLAASPLLLLLPTNAAKPAGHVEIEV